MGLLEKVAELELAAMEFASASDEAIRLEKQGTQGLNMQWAKERFERASERLKAARIEVYGEYWRQF